ncbi:MnhB domain-containing protein [Massilia aurea]|uniref:MnhB domain-containing protein n=1 Tax=Massilia aurea TaxID=373040 RepID=UPI003617ED62
MNTGRAIVLETTVSFLYWIMLAAAVWLLLRGHNAPGGGFVAALVAVAATVAHALVRGTAAARARLPLGPLSLSALGLALVERSGQPALALGQPFLTHLWGELGAGAVALKLSTVMLFDLGVALCVWGALSGFCLRLLGSMR